MWKKNKMVITEETNKFKDERNEIKQILNMLKDVKLPEDFYFVDDCIEIRYQKYWGFVDVKIADIDLDEKKECLIVSFVDEEEYKRLRNYFVNSQTKFKLNVNIVWK